MATEILRFEIDQGDLLKEAALAKEAILNTKNEVKELNTLFKFGQIPVEEYTASQVKLEAQLKRENAQYNNLTKAINTNSNSLDAQRLKLSRLVRERNQLDRSTSEGVKQFDLLTKEIKELNDEIGKHEQKAGDFRRNVGNYTESIKDAVGEINIAGTSVGNLTSQFAKFATPVGAAVGLLGGLVAAYTQSTTGARDLAFAQSRLSATFSIINEDLGKLVGGEEGGGGGKGILSRVVSAYGDYLKTIVNISTYGFFSKYLDEVAEKSRIAAEAQERLTDLTISAALAQGDFKEAERRAELQRRIRDDEQNSLEDRLAASRQIDEILEASAVRGRVVIEAQIAAIKESTINYENNRDAQLRVAQLTAEISDLTEDITGKLTENVEARRRLVEEARKQVEEERKLAAAQGRSVSGGAETASTVALQNEIDTNLRIQEAGLTAEFRLEERFARELEQLRIRNAQKERLTAKETAQFVAEQEQFKLAITSDIIGSISSLLDQQSEAYKALAIGQTFIDTYRAAAAALAPPPIGAGPLFGPALAAATIVAGLANVARISGVEFAQGGFTGPGFGTVDKTGFKPAGIVHEGEYVTPKRVVKSREAQPHINALERLRLRGYADGGQVVAAQATQEVNQAEILMRAIRNLPAPEISVREFTRVQNRVTTKETMTRK